MKKLLSMICVCLLTLSCGFLLAACGDTKLSSIAASDAVTSFEVGDNFVTTGLKVTATYSDNTTEVLEDDKYAVGDATLKSDNSVIVAVGGEFATAGEYSVKVTYDGKETSYDVTVIEKVYTIDDLDDLKGKVNAFFDSIEDDVTINVGDGEAVIKLQYVIETNYTLNRFYFLNSLPLSQKFTDANFYIEYNDQNYYADESEYYVEYDVTTDALYIIYGVDFQSQYEGKSWYIRKGMGIDYGLTSENWFDFLSEGFPNFLSTLKLQPWDGVEADGTITVVDDTYGKMAAKVKNDKLYFTIGDGDNAINYVVSDVGSTSIEIPNAFIGG